MARFTLPVSTKRQAGEFIMEICDFIACETSRYPHYFKADNEGVLHTSTLRDYFRKHGIQDTPPAPYKSRDAHVAEYGGQLVMRLARVAWLGSEGEGNDERVATKRT